MWFKKQKMKTYTVVSPKCLGYTTDLTMNLPEGFEAPISQINMWLRYYNLIDGVCAKQLTDQQKVIDKQATEIQGLQTQLKRYATEATEIRDTYDKACKENACLHGKAAELSAELEEAEDAYCDLHEEYEELLEVLHEFLTEEPEKPETKKQKKVKPNDQDQKRKSR